MSFRSGLVLRCGSSITLQVNGDNGEALRRLGIAVSTSPVSVRPVVVHPVDRTPELYDVRSEAVCPDCGARWRSNVDNTHQIVT